MRKIVLIFALLVGCDRGYINPNTDRVFQNICRIDSAIVAAIKIHDTTTVRLLREERALAQAEFDSIMN